MTKNGRLSSPPPPLKQGVFSATFYKIATISIQKICAKIPIAINGFHFSTSETDGAVPLRCSFYVPLGKNVDFVVSMVYGRTIRICFKVNQNRQREFYFLTAIRTFHFMVLLPLVLSIHRHNSKLD